MPEPRYLLAVVLLGLFSLAPLASGSAATVAAYAAPSQMTVHDGVHGVAQSNENERQDREDRRGRNQNDSDDNDDGEDWESPAPPPPQVQASPLVNVREQCLNAGQSVTLDGPDGSVAVVVYQNDVRVELAWVDPATTQQPPNGRVGNLVFGVMVGPCNGDWWSALPNEVNVGVRYADALAAGRDEGAFAVARYEGLAWTPADKGAADPPNNYTSASVAMSGTYGLIQK